MKYNISFWVKDCRVQTYKYYISWGMYTQVYSGGNQGTFLPKSVFTNTSTSSNTQKERELKEKQIERKRGKILTCCDKYRVEPVVGGEDGEYEAHHQTDRGDQHQVQRVLPAVQYARCHNNIIVGDEPEEWQV